MPKFGKDAVAAAVELSGSGDVAVGDEIGWVVRVADVRGLIVDEVDASSYQDLVRAFLKL